MKFTAIIAAGILATAVTAVSDQAKEAVDKSIQKDKDLLWRYCSQEGQPCAQVNKAVGSAAPFLTYPEIGHNTTERSACYQVGGACQIAKRSAEALAFAAANAYANANPEAHNRWCHLVGEPCLKARDFPSVYRREAVAEPEPEANAAPHNRWCHLVGEPCLRKREADATSQLVTRHNRWCHLVGEPCLKARRSAMPAPQPHNRWCHLVGEPCLKLKRAADEIGNALNRREASPHNRWCHLVGEPCLKARSLDDGPSDEDQYLEERCNAEGAPCDVAKRAADDLAFAATHAVEQAGL